MARRLRRRAARSPARGRRPRRRRGPAAPARRGRRRRCRRARRARWRGRPASLRDLERRAEAADLGELHGREVAGVELTGAPGVEGGDQALVGGEPHRDAPPQLDHLLEGPDRLLRQLDLVLRHRAQSLGGVADRPGAVRVHADRHLGAERLADGCHLGDVARQAHLELEGAEALRGPVGGDHAGRGRGWRREGSRCRSPAATRWRRAAARPARPWPGRPGRAARCRPPPAPGARRRGCGSEPGPTRSDPGLSRRRAAPASSARGSRQRSSRSRSRRAGRARPSRRDPPAPHRGSEPASACAPGAPLAQ